MNSFKKVSDIWNLENFNNNNYIVMWYGINVEKYFGKNIKIKKFMYILIV